MGSEGVTGREQRPLRDVVGVHVAPPSAGDVPHIYELSCGHVVQARPGRSDMPKRRRCSTCPPVLPVEDK